jgi:kinesin family protein C1
LLGDAKSSLGDAKSSLGDAKSSLGDAESSLVDATSSLVDATSSLGDAESSLGDAKSSLGDGSLGGTGQDEMALRKKLHNELVDIKGNIRVYCRVRPLLAEEEGENEAGPVVRYPVGDEKITLKNGQRDDKTFQVGSLG